MDFNLSIVIPVWNKYNFTRDCLRDLVRLGSDNEIIVVDNGSTDETQEKLTSFHQDLMSEYEEACYRRDRREINNDQLGQLKLIATANPPVYHRLPENRGFAQACNRGYKLASAPNVLFLNNDIRVRSDHHNWTVPLFQAAMRGELAGPTVGHLNPALNFVREDGVFGDGTLVDYLSGWCLVGSKKVFDKLVLPGDEGPFSSEFGLAYFEDTDLSMRAMSAGIAMSTVPVPVTHFGKMTSKALDTASLYTKARQIFTKKWADKLVWDANLHIKWGAV
jgi:GT2 family glycosyltransferase